MPVTLTEFLLGLAFIAMLVVIYIVLRKRNKRASLYFLLGVMSFYLFGWIWNTFA